MKSKFLEDFKKFAMRGNVVDMAVGIIIGGAFGKIGFVAGSRRHHASDRTVDRGSQLHRSQDHARKSGSLAGRRGRKAGRLDQLRQLSANHAGLSDYLVLDLPADPPVEQIAGEKERGSARTGAPPADVQLLTEIRDLLKNKQDK